jgi:hypothetical protein
MISTSSLSAKTEHIILSGSDIDEAEGDSQGFQPRRKKYIMKEHLHQRAICGHGTGTLDGAK